MNAKGARIDELPSLWDGFARLVRPGLGLSAFGANVMNLPPDYSTKSHDESGSGQEELYVRLAGSGAVVLDDDGTELPLDADPPGGRSTPIGWRRSGRVWRARCAAAPRACRCSSSAARPARRTSRLTGHRRASSATVSSSSSLPPRLAISRSASASSARRRLSASVVRACLMR